MGQSHRHVWMSIRLPHVLSQSQPKMTGQIHSCWKIHMVSRYILSSTLNLDRGSMSRRGHAVRHTMRSKRQCVTLAPVHRMRRERSPDLRTRSSSHDFATGGGERAETIAFSPRTFSASPVVGTRLVTPGRWDYPHVLELDTCWAGVEFKIRVVTRLLVFRRY